MPDIFHLKFTKFSFGWSSAPDPAGEFTALPRLPAGFGEWKKRRESRRRERENEEGKGKEDSWSFGPWVTDAPGAATY